MLLAETFSRTKIRMTEIMGYALALMIPFSVFWRAGNPTIPYSFRMYVSPGIYLTDIFAIIFIIFALKDIFDRYTFQEVINLFSYSNIIAVPLSLIVILGGATIVTSLYPMQALFVSLRWLLALLVFLTLTLVDLPIKNLIKVFLIGLLIQTLVGVLQFVKGGPLGLPGELALSLANPHAPSIEILGKTFLRAYGLTFNPNVLGGYLAVGIILCVPLLKKWGWRLLWWGLIIGLVLTFSKAAIISVSICVALVGIWLFWRKKEMRISHAISCGLIKILSNGWLVLSGFSIEQVMLMNTSSIDMRFVYSDVATEVIKNNPIIGVGAGNFIGTTIRVFLISRPDYVHNVILLLGAEIGLMGAFLWVWLWFVPLTLRRGIWRTKDADKVALVGAWVCLGIISLWDFYPWGLESGRLLSVFVLGLLTNLILVTPHRREVLFES